ncbi:Uncharacterized protein HZ326_11651 [Fusarium oxysporum f. sp. albedinis]|nr:Uncharacterized protein HZ326_11651 [Fusarium oxysporum f. sp. albedinis]
MLSHQSADDLSFKKNTDIAPARPSTCPSSPLVSSEDETSHLRRVAVVQPDWTVQWPDRAPCRYTLEACATLGRLGVGLESSIGIIQDHRLAASSSTVASRYRCYPLHALQRDLTFF